MKEHPDGPHVGLLQVLLWPRISKTSRNRDDSACALMNSCGCDGRVSRLLPGRGGDIGDTLRPTEGPYCVSDESTVTAVSTGRVHVLTRRLPLTPVYSGRVLR